MSWLTVGEAAAYVRSGKERIYSAIYSGELAAHKLSPSSPAIINVSELDEWVRQHPSPVKERASMGEAPNRSDDQ